MRRLAGFTKALLTESAKRLPWILLLLGIIIVGQNIQTSKLQNQNQTTLLKKIASQSADIKRLSEQNHALSQQAIDLSNRSAQQVDCVKQLFVDYINTHQPITKANSATCTVTGHATPVATEPEPTTRPRAVETTSTKQPTTAPPPTNPQGKPARGLLHRLLHLLRLE